MPNEDPSAVNEGTWTPDLSSLSGKQFIRFRIRLNVAKGTTVTPTSTKPQVNFVRMRFKF